MQKRRNKRLDQTGFGLIIGFALPVLIFWIVYKAGENEISFQNYISNLRRLSALVKLISLCVFTNSLVFMGMIRLKYERIARGILGATVIYAIGVLISRTL